MEASCTVQTLYRQRNSCKFFSESDKKKKKKKKRIGKNPVSDPGPSWPSCSFKGIFVFFNMQYVYAKSIKKDHRSINFFAEKNCVIRFGEISHLINYHLPQNFVIAMLNRLNLNLIRISISFDLRLFYVIKPRGYFLDYK